MKDKKAVLGLDTAKLFVLAILALVIIIIVAFVVLNSVSDMGTLKSKATLTNVTTDQKVDEVGAYPTGYDGTVQDCELTITKVINMSGASALVIDSANYSISGCSIIYGGTIGYPNNSYWNITGSVKFAGDARNIFFNVSDASTDFIEDAGTWFTLIGVVIIILIIAVVIVVVNRFGGGTGSFNTGGYTSGGSGGTPGGEIGFRRREGSSSAPNI